ncbi:hypothetical protein KIN20_004616 [Parelaphostrongylus tenuis]|uniref:RanBD1 domain-containing protein n=1 Tax=Parelaphostrongylus tenuis TaxID=148309 RepID=A0AAD5QEK5_PARTN|nr:hypothetical protein KIN20_004616 [Parelaphostrongylus tenuis]
MAVSEFNKETSEQLMRKLQFHDKLSRLNKEFIRQLQEWYNQPQIHSASLASSHARRLGGEHPKVTSDLCCRPSEEVEYREIVPPTNNQLYEMYHEKAATRTVSKSPPTTERKIVKAKRRIKDAAKDNGLSSSTKVSTPSGAPPRFSLGGDVSAIKPNVDVTLTLATPKGVSSVAASVPTISVIALPKPTPGFWSTQKKDVDSSSSPKPAISFGSIKSSSLSKEQDKNHLSTLSFPKFGVEKDEDSSKKSAMPFGSTDVGDKSGDSEKKSPLSFPKFGVDKDEDSSKKPPLSFPSFAVSKDKEKDGEKNTLTFPSFGSTAANNAPSGGLKFSFGTLPKSSTEGEKKEDEEEYVPPKVEVVENEEPDAVFSTKCSVFKFVDKQYSKVGIGMFHLKEVDGKKSVLVRAATAIGTVWINALINKAMKVAKVDEKGEKIRLTYPASEEEISTYVIRFPSAKEASRVLEDIEAAAK